MLSRSGSSHLPIALDIGSGSIKALQLQRQAERLTARAAVRTDYPPNLRRTAERRDFTTTALRDMLKTHDFTGREVITLVPNDLIRFKSFRIPQVPEDERAQVVLFEASERFAFQEGEAEYRYLHAGEVRQGQETRDEIIAMGCDTEPLNAMLDVIRKLGLVCRAIDVAPCAVVRSMEGHLDHAADERTRMYADLGQHATTVIVTVGGRIVFVKSVAIGAGKLDELTAKNLNLPLPEAIQLRREVQGRSLANSTAEAPKPDTEIIDTVVHAVRPGYEQLAKEISLCLRYYAVTFRGVRPEELVCVGGLSQDELIRQTITEITGVPALQGVLPEHIDFGITRPIDEARQGLPEWVTAVGLSLRLNPCAAAKKAAS